MTIHLGAVLVCKLSVPGVCPPRGSAVRKQVVSILFAPGRFKTYAAYIGCANTNSLGWNCRDSSHSYAIVLVLSFGMPLHKTLSVYIMKLPRAVRQALTHSFVFCTSSLHQDL